MRRKRHVWLHFPAPIPPPGGLALARSARSGCRCRRSHLKGVVSEVNEEAAARGIVTGMTSAQAMARETSLIIRPRSPAQEECLNQILVQTALALSPDVELCCDGACVADLRRVGKETCWQQLADQQIAHLGTQGLCAVMGIAPTPDLALLAARGAQPSAVVYDAGAFTSRLPIETLEPPEDLLQILHGWGIHRVGEFLALPKTETIERLGPAAEVLRRKVSGRNKRLLRLIRPAPEYAEAFDFDCEIETVEPLLFLLRRFLDGLCGRLRAVYRVAQRLVLCLPLEDGSCHERAFCIPVPTADVDVLFRILHTHLENLETRKATDWCAAEHPGGPSCEGSAPALRKRSAGSQSIWRNTRKIKGVSWQRQCRRARQKQHPPAGFLCAGGLLCRGNGNRKRACMCHRTATRTFLATISSCSPELRPHEKWTPGLDGIVGGVRHRSQLRRSLIGFPETGGTANAGSKRNGMWRSPKAASTASHAMGPSGKSKAAMKGVGSGFTEPNFFKAKTSPLCCSP